VDRYEEALKTYVLRPERKGKAIAQEKSTRRLVRRHLEENITLPCLAGSNNYERVNWITDLAGSGHGQYILANRGDVTFRINRYRVAPGSAGIVYGGKHVLRYSDYTYYFGLPGARRRPPLTSPPLPSPPPPQSCVIL
ncbi:1798_t:CDS:2, partial [Paraglomus occultum]